jgi:hypothetical protein
MKNIQLADEDGRGDRRPARDRCGSVPPLYTLAVSVVEIMCEIETTTSTKIIMEKLSHTIGASCNKY